MEDQEKKINQFLSKETNKMFIYVGLLEKKNDRTASFKPVGGWRVSRNKKEAKGDAFEYLMEKFKDYSVSYLNVEEVDVDLVLQKIHE